MIRQISFFPSYPGTVYSIVKSPNTLLRSSGNTWKDSLGDASTASRSTIMLSDSDWSSKSTAKAWDE